MNTTILLMINEEIDVQTVGVIFICILILLQNKPEEIKTWMHQ